MSVEKQAFKGVVWLGIFKAISQAVSWVSTIIVARLLIPGDYGLLAMATVITGFAMLFNELGLGAAIVQNPKPSQRELSSVFWFAMSVSLFLSLSCFPVSYITAWIFDESRVIPLTQTTSILFLFAGSQIIPLSLLKKELRFKETGFIQTVSVILSCIFMLMMAVSGAGVWTLIGGHLVRSCVAVLLLFHAAKWKPSLTFHLSEALSYIKFGITVAIGNSARYINESSDTFFAGRVWSPIILGNYSFAKQLSKIPNDKIVSLIGQVAFPTFSALQNEKERFNQFYLDLVKVIVILTLPLYIGGFFVAEDFILIFLGDKWAPAIFIFKYLCISEIFTPIAAINGQVHGAQGRPLWYLYFYVILAICMSISFFIAAPYGLKFMIVPWLTVYILCSLLLNYATIKKIGVSSFRYLKNIFAPLVAASAMALTIIFTEKLFYKFSIDIMSSRLLEFIVKILLGATVYCLCILMIDKEIISNINKVRRR